MAVSAGEATWAWVAILVLLLAPIEPCSSSKARGRVAVCLVGAARDVELTAPSILLRLVQAYQPCDLFLHSPLDHNAFKLWAFDPSAINPGAFDPSAAAAPGGARASDDRSAAAKGPSAPRGTGSGERVTGVLGHSPAPPSGSARRGLQGHGPEAAMEGRRAQETEAQFSSWMGQAPGAAGSDSAGPEGATGTEGPTGTEGASEGFPEPPGPVAGERVQAQGSPDAGDTWGREAWAAPVRLAAVRIFPSDHVSEAQFPWQVLAHWQSPGGIQGLLQYFRLVEGCVPLIQNFQAATGTEYSWVVRSRVDGFWGGMPPPLASLRRDRYTVPNGNHAGGFNDRLGIGTPNVSFLALSRLNALHDIARAGGRALNSEAALKEHLRLAQVTVAKADVPFCIVTRRSSWAGCQPGMYSLNSTAPLNGAKCRPCLPCATGEAASALLRRVSPGSKAYPGPFTAGIGICPAHATWPPGWEGVFDSQAGPELAEYRRSIMNSDLEDCTGRFLQMRNSAFSWEGSTSPRAICVRRFLGEAVVLGTGTGSFHTFTGPLRNNSLVYVSDKPSLGGRRSWEGQLQEHLTWGGKWSARNRRKRRGGGWEYLVPPSKLVVEFVAGCCHPGMLTLGEDLEGIRGFLGGRVFSIVKLKEDGSELRLLDSWEAKNAVLPACQLLVAFTEEDIERGRKKHFLDVLENMSFSLNSCIQFGKEQVQRCTFFSTRFCTSL